MFRFRSPASTLLIAGMFAVTLVTGASDALAQGRREGKPVSKLRGEDFYRGIFMAQGPVAERIPWIRDHLVLRPPKQKARAAGTLDDFDGRLVQSIRSAPPCSGPPRLQRVLFPIGVLFHAGIIVLHGLVSFGTCVIAALILYLRAPLASRQEGTATEAEPLASRAEPERLVA